MGKMSAQEHFNKQTSDVDIVFIPLDFSVTSARIREHFVALLPNASRIADLGCSHGTNLIEMTRLAPQAKIVGFDFSDVALGKAKTFTKGNENISFQQIDFLNEAIGKEEFDLAFCSQVIEHIPGDARFLENVAASMKQGGTLMLSTVYKKKGAWYLYKKPSGERVLEPTHVKEYTDTEELLTILREAGFEILDYDLRLFKFPLIDVALKIMTKLFKNRFVFNIVNSKAITFLRRITQVPIFGFYNFQILARKV